MKMIDFEFASNNDRVYELIFLVTETFYTEQLMLELIGAYYGSAPGLWKLMRPAERRPRWAFWPSSLWF